jgi:hypothetical protein
VNCSHAERHSRMIAVYRWAQACSNSANRVAAAASVGAVQVCRRSLLIWPQYLLDIST